MLNPLYRIYQGKEIARIETTFIGRSFAYNADQLQDKSDRYYFQDSISLPNGAVYMSPLDLNVENGKVQIPYTPTIRFATPVIRDGKTYGEFVINVYAENFLAPLGEGDPPAFLIDTDGYYLYHPDEDQTLGTWPRHRRQHHQWSTGAGSRNLHEQIWLFSNRRLPFYL